MKATRFLQQVYRPISTRPVQQACTSIPRTIRSSNPLASTAPSPFSSLLLRNTHRTSIRRLLNKHFSSSKPPYNPTPNLNSPSLSITQRFRKLSREYGWSAVGVYLALSALDFPFCFLAVRWLGTERIGRWEHIILEWFWKIIPYPKTSAEDTGHGEVQVAGQKRDEYGVVSSGDVEVGIPGYDHGVAEADKRNQSDDASMWTQLALAYAVHKSFIFVRVPLTAAVLPKTVKTLRGFGFDIGKRRPKGPKGANKD